MFSHDSLNGDTQELLDKVCHFFSEGKATFLSTVINGLQSFTFDATPRVLRVLCLFVHTF